MAAKRADTRHRFLKPRSGSRVVFMCLVAAWVLGMARVAAAQTTLRTRADRLGFLIGCAAWESGTKGHEPAYTATLAREFNLVATRAQLCTGVVQPNRGTYQFAEADQIFEFAQQHKMKVWGHCLLSTQDNSATLPGWIKDGDFSREELLGIMREHLHAVIGRYRGRAIAWSVINEPMKDDAFWRRRVGEDWIEQALLFAHEADPQATLLLNEFGIERGPKDGKKWEKFYGLVKSMKAKGVPIHAVGFQSYFDSSTNLADVAGAMQLFADLGIKVHVTELAVRVHTAAPTPQQLEQQAAIYRSALKTCLAAPNCEVMTIFGVTDKLHWLVLSGNQEAPVLFDGQYRPKPAYHALLDELERTGQRTADATRKYLGWMKELDRAAPIHYQEPFRRDYLDYRGYWQPEVETFCTDLRNARRGGAAGWCFHNRSPSPPERFPAGNRRSFDMRPSPGRLMDQFDAVERQFLKGMASCVQ